MSADTRVLLHVSDWNFQDKYYEVPFSLLAEFKTRILAGDDKDPHETWTWFTDQVDFDDPKAKIAYVQEAVDMRLEEYFFDFAFEPKQSVREWELG